MTTGIVYGFAEPFLESTAATASAAVPEKYDVALDGLELMLDQGPQFRSIETLRQQQNVGEAAEVSLNPEGFWRRSQSSWHLGAGQDTLDGPDSSRYRFRDSFGVDVWTKYELTLLPEMEQSAAVSVTPVLLASANDARFYSNNTNVVKVGTGNLTGMPGGAVTVLCSTGNYLLIGITGAGVYKCAASGSAASAYITDAVTPSVVAWVKDRVIVCVGAAVYNPTTAFSSSGALPSALFTHNDSGFTWVGAAEGLSHLYLAGYSGERSVIYKTAVRADGTALDVPSVAGRLPEGERVTGIYGYLGAVVIGTTEGLRLAVADDSSGDLTIGALVDIPGGVSGAFYGYRTGVYFGLTAAATYGDGTTRAGVGRVDLEYLADTDRLLPAWATDRAIAGTAADVNGLCVIDGELTFTADDLGLYIESGDLEAAGWLRTGRITNDIAEDKIVTGARAAWTGDGEVSLQLANRGAAFTTIAETGEQIRGDVAELKLNLERSSLDATAGPTLKTATLLSIPAPAGSYLIILNVLLHEAIECRNGVEETLDVDAALTRLKAMWSEKRLVALQLGNYTYTVTVEKFQFAESTRGHGEGVWNGICQLTCKVVV